MTASRSAWRPTGDFQFSVGAKPPQVLACSCRAAGRSDGAGAGSRRPLLSPADGARARPRAVARPARRAAATGRAAGPVGRSAPSHGGARAHASRSVRRSSSPARLLSPSITRAARSSPVTVGAGRSPGVARRLVRRHRSLRARIALSATRIRKPSLSRLRSAVSAESPNSAGASAGPGVVEHVRRRQARIYARRARQRRQRPVGGGGRRALGPQRRRPADHGQEQHLAMPPASTSPASPAAWAAGWEAPEHDAAMIAWLPTTPPRLPTPTSSPPTSEKIDSRPGAPTGRPVTQPDERRDRHHSASARSPPSAAGRPAPARRSRPASRRRPSSRRRPDPRRDRIPRRRRAGSPPAGPPEPRWRGGRTAPHRERRCPASRAAAGLRCPGALTGSDASIFGTSCPRSSIPAAPGSATSRRS